VNDPFVVKGKTNVEKDRLVVGAYIPRRQAELLALHALHRGVPRSHLVNEALADWIDNARDSISNEQIIQNLTDRAIREWNNRQEMSGQDPDWNEEKEKVKYVKAITKSLLRRGIPRGVISQIAWKLEEER
jgi:hypothetical protein